jgi:hypothetical protein
VLIADLAVDLDSIAHRTAVDLCDEAQVAEAAIVVSE